MIEPGDTGQDVRCFFGTLRHRFIELPPRMRPATHFDDSLLTEEFIVATVGVGMDVAAIITEIIQRPFFAAIYGEIVGRQGGASSTPHIETHSRDFLSFPFPLTCRGRGVSSVNRTSPSRTACRKAFSRPEMLS